LTESVGRCEVGGALVINIREIDLAVAAVFIHFTARLIGLIGVDTDERLALMRSFAGPLAAATSSEHLSDRDVVNRAAPGTGSSVAG
jgi:hypothetical protein